jgi:hypothetical protein
VSKSSKRAVRPLVDLDRSSALAAVVTVALHEKSQTRSANDFHFDTPS